MTGLPMELVVQEGPGLVYVVYPYAATKLAAPPVWSCMFFIMMLCLGMGTMVFKTYSIVYLIIINNLVCLDGFC